MLVTTLTELLWIKISMTAMDLLERIADLNSFSKIICDSRWTTLNANFCGPDFSKYYIFYQNKVFSKNIF